MIVHRGQPVKVSVRTPSLAACLAEARYSDGSRQSSGIKHAHDGLVTWTVRVPNNAALGQARWSVRCGVTWQRTGTWLVKPATATKVDSTPHLLVDKQGFSQRNDKLGTGSTVSYGLLLKNTSTTQDATETYLLINFATASGELIGTVTKKVELRRRERHVRLRRFAAPAHADAGLEPRGDDQGALPRAGQAPDPAPLRQPPHPAERDGLRLDRRGRR